MIEREAAMFRAADVIIAIQSFEQEWLTAQFPDAQVVLAPHPIESDASTSPALRHEKRAPIALFVGSTNGPNLDGMTWFKDEVWPLVLAQMPEAQLHVAGDICILDNWPENSVRLGRVDDLSTCYVEAAVAVVPIRFGSGLKIKLVEALGYGVPVVATHSATQGVPPFPDGVLRIASDAQGFADAVVQALQNMDPEISLKISGYIRSNFAAATVGARIINALDQH